MRTTVIIDDSRPEAKALIEYLRTLNYVEIENEGEEIGFDLCYSMQEMDSKLDQALKEMEEGDGMDHEEVFRRLKAGTL